MKKGQFPQKGTKNKKKTKKTKKQYVLNCWKDFFYKATVWSCYGGCAKYQQYYTLGIKHGFPCINIC